MGAAPGALLRWTPPPRRRDRRGGERGRGRQAPRRLLAFFLAFREGREHFHGAFEHRQVLLAHFLQIAEGEHAAQGVLHGLAHLLLVLGEHAHGLFQIARNHPLHVVAVEGNELPQEVDRQEVGALGFLLDDDLGQHAARDVVPGLGVVDHEVHVVLHHLTEVVERHVAAGRGVVETPVGVLLDDHDVLACRLVLRTGGLLRGRLVLIHISTALSLLYVALQQGLCCAAQSPVNVSEFS